MYPTVAAAEAAGYQRAGPYSPGLGAHYIRPTARAQFRRRDGRQRPPVTAGHHLRRHGPRLTDRGLHVLLDEQGRAARVRRAERSLALPHQHLHQVHADRTIDAPFGADTDVPADLCVQGGRPVCVQTQWMVHVWSVPGWESRQGLFGEVNPAARRAPTARYYQYPKEQWWTTRSTRVSAQPATGLAEYPVGDDVRAWSLVVRGRRVVAARSMAAARTCTQHRHCARNDSNRTGGSDGIVRRADCCRHRRRLRDGPRAGRPTRDRGLLGRDL